MNALSRLKRIAVPLLLVTFLPALANAAPYGPEGRAVEWVQPGGENLNLRVFGDEYYARTETLNGYTVVYSESDGAYHYAEPAANGNSLKASGIQAHLPAKDGLAKHLDLSVAGIRKIHQANRATLDGEREKRWNERVQAARVLRAARGEGRELDASEAAAAKIKAAPINGNLVGLTILAQFPNDPETNSSDAINFPVSKEKMINFCNQEGYIANGNTGSVRDYYFDQSLGKLIYTQTVPQIVTLPNPRSFYNFSDYPDNKKLRGSGAAGRMIIADAVQVLQDQNFDFTSLSTDGSNNALATNLMFAGKDSGVWSKGLWPHQWRLSSGLEVGTDETPVKLLNYQITNVEDNAPVIGTFCHENGHLILDYPDLYDNRGEGVGEHCLMGSGSHLNDGKTPAPINAYFKDIVGWADVTNLAADEFVTHTLPTTGNVSYRIRKPDEDTEFFMVENRGSGDKWAQHAKDKGIAIWHIDETINGNLYARPHYMVALEQADGDSDLERGRNRGDSTDLFDLARPSFNDLTKPNAEWWDGSKSDVRIEVLEAAGANIRVQFSELPPDTILVSAPNGGEVAYVDSELLIRWQANIAGRVKIELYKSGVFHTEIAEDAPNTGEYLWAIPATFEAGNNFSIRISSITNTIPASDDSDDSFQISDATFPERNVMPYGWFTPPDSETKWMVTTSEAYEGASCLVNAVLEDGSTAGVAFKSNFLEGTLSFYMKASTEGGYDSASFYIDGVRQTFSEALKKELTGEVPWTFFSFPISAGNHTFKWVYEKDDSYGSINDSVWLDGVVLPPTTQEIAVKDPAGEDLTSNGAVSVFPDAGVGLSSKPQIFTVRNVGDADLYGLKVVTKGSNANAFQIGDLGKNALTPGGITTFEVTFAPGQIGLTTAEIRVVSNDADENPFVIKVEGTAYGVPEISVTQGGDTLEDDVTVTNFGDVSVDSGGKIKTFRIQNMGSAELTGLSLDISGTNKDDFAAGALDSPSLAPGGTTTFSVTFTPSEATASLATLRITSNALNTASFDIGLKGNGVTKHRIKPAASVGILSARAVPGVGLDDNDGVAATFTTTNFIAGRKYLILTVVKPVLGDGLTRTVEVSGNLVDWYSGANHTTVLEDSPAFLKVRDNTPVTGEAKRHIRLKTTRP